ncbi:hypothetical protein MATL_G00115560 [Megalops atlanticus]|uniref:C-type lectin domain-containing protein n=1 Tax=Megalops atlanticus TaxID=7932 RepID=A0A9D3PWQ3_MEGAT|nr:hypothetical protein MATL_G00115560 [Megalops atlanticus]
MSEDVLYADVQFKKNLINETAGSHCRRAGNQIEDVAYSGVNSTDSTSPHTVSHCGPEDHDVYCTVGQTSHNSPEAPNKEHVYSEKSWQRSHSYRMAALCLGLLCVLLLAAIIALCVHYIRYKEQLQRNYITLTRDKDQLQKNLNVLSQKYPFLNLFCPLVSEKRVCRACPQGWELFNSTCYYFSTEGKSWMDSRKACLEEGADLVVIESQQEHEFINKHTTEEFYWIGVSDSETEGTWLWVDRTPLQKGFWKSAEPDNYYWKDSAIFPFEPWTLFVFLQDYNLDTQ